MAELPGYKKSVALQPQAQPVGFTQAAEEAATASSFLGQLGAQVAQSAANERARIAGIEASKTPGMKFLPPIGEAEAHFQKAYRGQEYALAMTNGNAVLNKFAVNVKNNLSPKTLLDYDAIVNDYIDKNTNELTSENATIVRNELRNQYLNQRAQLADKLYSNTQESNKNNFKRAFETMADQITEAMAVNDKEGAARINRDFITRIDEGEFEGLFTPLEIQEIKRAAIERLDLAYKQADARELIAKGKMEAILKERTKLPPTADNIQTTEVYANEYRLNQQLVNAQEELIVSNLKTKQVNNTFTDIDMITAKQELSPLKYAHFQLDTAKWMAAKKEDENLFAFFEANMGNAMALSGLSGGQLDKAFAQLLKNHALQTGAPPDIYAEAALASKIDVAIPSVNKKLTAGINSRNPQMSVAASNIFSSLATRNPNTVSGVDSKSAMKADMIVSNGSDEEAWKYATNKLDNLTPKQMEENKALFKAELADRELKNPLVQKVMIASRMGFASKDMPPGLQTEYMDKLEKNYVISRDWEIANKNAADELKRSWKETNVNGFKQIMWMPPDAQIDPMIIKESIREDIGKLFAAQEKEFLKPDSQIPFYFKLIQTPTEQVLSDVGLKYAENKQVHIAMVDVDQKEIPGILMVVPDADTAYPEPGKPPSYSFQFQADGSNVPQLIYEPDNWSNARFYLPIEKVMANQDAEKQRQQAKKLELEAEAIAKLQRKYDMIDLKLSLGEGLFSE